MPVRIGTIDKLVVGENRIRREFKEKDILDLSEDIAKNGLYHPIVCREGEDDTLILIAGERRLRAIRKLHDEHIDFKCDGLTILSVQKLFPFNLIKDLTESQALEIELHENLLRVDIDWRDVTAARARLHRLRESEATARGEAWSKSDTAKEIADTTGMHPTAAAQSVTRALALEEHLDNPMLQNVTSERKAFELVAKQIEGEFASELARRESAQGTAAPGYEYGLEGLPESGTVASQKHTLIHGDFREVEIPPKTFDLVLVDPPYGVEAHNFGSAAQQIHDYQDDAVSAMSLCETILNDSYFHWTKDEAHLFMFCDIEYFTILRNKAGICGWRVFRTPMVWHAPRAGHIPWGPDHLRREHQYILYATKGDKPLRRMVSDVVTIPREQNATHAARKPAGLIQFLISIACLPGSRVLDPCCGSGSVFKAADGAECFAFGIEKKEAMYNVAATEIVK